MNILLFWVKVILKRIIEFIKISPVITIGGIIILTAFVYTSTNIQLTLDITKFIITCSILVSIPIIISLKEYNVLKTMTFYAKSNYSNQLLRYIFFIRKSLLNNFFIILFFIFIFSNIIILDFSFDVWKILCIFPFSVFLSLIVIFLRNSNKKINKQREKIPINPIIKSTLYDYMDSILMAIIIIVLSLFIGIELLRDKNILSEMAEPVFVPLILFVLLSIGFIGLSDSMSNTNWLFYAIISLNFKYHLKRTIMFIVSFYGIVMLQYTITLMYIDATLLLIHLFAIISTMLFSIGIAYSKGNIIRKIIVYGLYIRITVYVLYFNPYIMLASVFPVIIVFFIAKSDFTEWGYL